MVDAAAGEAVRGSWWSHSQSHAIFRALERLREDPDAFLCKLVDGKQTYVHRRLWPALLRLQAEASLWPAVSPEARRLLQRIEREGAVQATGRRRLELERSLRVVARSVHTPSGTHCVVLTPFTSHFSQAEQAAAAQLTLQEAQAALRLGRAGDASRGPPRPSPRRATGRRVRGSTAGPPLPQSAPAPGASPPRTSPRASRPAPPSGRRPPRRR